LSDIFICSGLDGFAHLFRIGCIIYRFYSFRLNICAKPRLSLKNPPKTPAEYLDTLLVQGLPQSVATLRELCYQS
jgi:hypothetical protein